MEIEAGRVGELCDRSVRTQESVFLPAGLVCAMPCALGADRKSLLRGSGWPVLQFPVHSSLLPVPVFPSRCCRRLSRAFSPSLAGIDGTCPRRASPLGCSPPLGEASPPSFTHSFSFRARFVLSFVSLPLFLSSTPSFIRPTNALFVSVILFCFCSVCWFLFVADKKTECSIIVDKNVVITAFRKALVLKLFTFWAFYKNDLILNVSFRLAHKICVHRQIL